ncbi:MAG TPA: cytochrome P450 [Bryobacteraceae bacterium]|jgi:cytochrome P450|nr:cytochrome P450 [Bryobacteraceae bacterium]
MPRFLQILRALFSDRIRAIERLGARHPRIGRAEFGPVNVVLVNTPDLVPEVLIDRAADFQKGPILRTFSRPLLGNGLLVSEGEEHLARRKLVAPAFAHHRVARYADVMREHAESMQSTWSDGLGLDIAQAMMHLTLGIVGQTLFDVDLLGQAETLGRDITELQVWLVRQRRIPFRIPFLRRPQAALTRLNETIYRLIRDRRASGEDKGDLLSMLLLSRDEETGRTLDDEQVRDEAMTLFVAGHETTAQAMAWSWYLLAQNPACFARLRSEGMPYALQMMKEAMRLYPPAFIIARSALRDTSIGGFAIRKDEIVLIAPWLLHRDPRYFDDPLRFDPDRFLPDREAALPRFAYMPFGGGRRICIGNQFALMEGQIILSTIAREVSMVLTSSKPVGLQPLITLRPKGGIHVRIHRHSRH